MSLTFYYAPMSSSTRVHWALEELGLPYEKVCVDLAAGEQRAPEFLKLNPHGKVPVLVVDGAPMFESLAILLFLGERFGVARNLWFAHDHPHYPEALSWTVWGSVTFSAHVFRWLLAAGERVPPEQRNSAIAEATRRDLAADLTALERHLADREYLFEQRFTLADLAIAAFFPFALSSGAVDLADFPKVAAWVSRCTSRPDMALAIQG
ncbi:MAG: glutathione S-transferase family protein [Polyangiales bacterium]